MLCNSALPIYRQLDLYELNKGKGMLLQLAQYDEYPVRMSARNFDIAISSSNKKLTDSY